MATAVLTVRLPNSEAAAVRRHALDHGLPVSHVLRRALAERLALHTTTAI